MSDPRIGTDIDDKFRLLSVLGQGGMGVVYLATQKSMNRQVAVKVLHPAASERPQAVKRFLREARTVSKLLHPNIVTVFEFGRTPRDELYLVMELLQGRTLADEVSNHGALEPGRAVHIIAQACDAIHHAHESDLLHRDLKPDNIFLLTSSARQPDFVKVLDFGIARERDPDVGEQLTDSGVICGTPSYMAPEQILGDPLSPATDVYALGVTAFQALTGNRPFNATSKMRMMMAHVEQPAPTFASFGIEGLPPRLEETVRWALAKRPDRRPSSVLEFADALVDALRGSSAAASPAPLVEAVALDSVPDKPVGPATELATVDPGAKMQLKSARTRTVDSLAVRELKTHAALAATSAAQAPSNPAVPAGTEEPLADFASATTDTGEDIDTSAALREHGTAPPVKGWNRRRVAGVVAAAAGIAAAAGLLLADPSQPSQRPASEAKSTPQQDAPSADARPGEGPVEVKVPNDMVAVEQRAAAEASVVAVAAKPDAATPKVQVAETDASPEATPVAEPDAVVADAPTPLPATPARDVLKGNRRRCVLTVRPASAAVWVGGERIGSRRVTVDAPMAGQELVATVVRKGYRTERVTLTAGCKPQSVRLSRLPRTAVPKGPEGTGIIE